MSLSFIFSPDSREVFARLSRDRRMSVAKKFCMVNLPKFRGDSFATLTRICTTVVQQSYEIFGRKNLHKIFKHVENLREYNLSVIFHKVKSYYPDFAFGSQTNYASQVT